MCTQPEMPGEHPSAGRHAAGRDEQHRAGAAGEQELSPQREERVAAALGDQVPSRVQDGRGQREDGGFEHARSAGRP